MIPLVARCGSSVASNARRLCSWLGSGLLAYRAPPAGATRGRRCTPDVVDSSSVLRIAPDVACLSSRRSVGVPAGPNRCGVGTSTVAPEGRNLPPLGSCVCWIRGSRWPIVAPCRAAHCAADGGELGETCGRNRTCAAALHCGVRKTRRSRGCRTRSSPGVIEARLSIHLCSRRGLCRGPLVHAGRLRVGVQGG